MLKRVILILVAITLVSWFVKVQLDDRRDEALYKEKREQYLERAKGRVESLKRSSGASFDWSEKLGSKFWRDWGDLGGEKTLGAILETRK